MINKFETFDELMDAFNGYDWDYSHPQEMTTSGYGEKRMVGVASCGHDDGDVSVYAVRDTEENRAAILLKVNQQVDEVNKYNEEHEWKVEMGEFLDERVKNLFDEFHFSASLWG